MNRYTPHTPIKKQRVIFSFFTKVKDQEMALVISVKKSADFAKWISINGFRTQCWKRHSDAFWGNIGKIEIETVFLESRFLPSNITSCPIEDARQS